MQTDLYNIRHMLELGIFLFYIKHCFQLFFILYVFYTIKIK